LIGKAQPQDHLPVTLLFDNNHLSFLPPHPSITGKHIINVIIIITQAPIKPPVLSNAIIIILDEKEAGFDGPHHDDCHPWE